MSNQRYKSILTEYSKIDPIDESSEEGVDYINVSKYSKTELGRALAPGAKANFDTILGRIGNIRSAMDYVAIPNYPIKLLSKSRLNAKDIKKIPKKRISIPNYWSIITYILAERIKSEPDLIKMIKENEAEYTCFSSKGKANLFGKEVFITQPNNSMGRYIAIIRCISKLIKNDEFTDAKIYQLINSAKDCPEKLIFEGSTVNVKM